jgi:2-polyprenyl-3-methyl-5-hydroxy-6-metoxy-1,4-benzoquinol methylase
MASESLALTPEEIRRRVAHYDWYHRLDLGHGIETPGTYDLRGIIQNYGLPEDLNGRSVLDVGPGHGFFAFEFERRGATVSTAELPHWSEHDASPDLQQEFDTQTRQGDAPDAYHRGAIGFAIEARRSKVKRQFCNVYDLTAERVGTYDLVFCSSVLLHLTDPLRALYGIRRVCRDQAIICTGIDPSATLSNMSVAQFVGRADGQAFWLPTMACLEQMALAAGFARVERVATFNLRSVDGVFDTPHGTVRAFVS